MALDLKDAERIANIIATADGGCSVCISSLVEKLNTEFPEALFTMIHPKAGGDVRVVVSKGHTRRLG